MKAPLSWLREYVPIEHGGRRDSPRAWPSPAPRWSGWPRWASRDGENLQRFVVGKVLECRRHPDADKLSVCMVDVGEARAAHHRLRRAQRGRRPDGGGGPARRA